MRTPDIIQGIADRLTFLCHRIVVDGASNRLNMYLDSEDFFSNILNAVFGVKLKNANYQHFNTPGYDLIDPHAKLVVQVTADKSRSKIQDTLKSIPASCSGYTLKIMLLMPKKPQMRKQSFENPSQLLFSPHDDILDVGMLVNMVRGLGADEVERIYEYVVKEMAPHYPIVDNRMVDSLLVDIVEILLSAPAAEGASPNNLAPFSIDEKIDLNGLGLYRKQMRLMAGYVGKLDGIYGTYAQQGTDAATPIQVDFNNAYVKLSRLIDDPISLYDAIVEDRLEFVAAHPSCPCCSLEQLRTGVSTVMVDAFMRCNVFEGPDLLKEANEAYVVAQ